MVIAPVHATVTNATANINCGQTANLEWTTADAVDVSWDQSVGKVANSGSQGVSPHATTTYTLTAAGPGGIVT